MGQDFPRRHAPAPAAGSVPETVVVCHIHANRLADAKALVENSKGAVEALVNFDASPRQRGGMSWQGDINDQSTEAHGVVIGNHAVELEAEVFVQALRNWLPS